MQASDRGGAIIRGVAGPERHGSVIDTRPSMGCPPRSKVRRSGRDVLEEVTAPVPTSLLHAPGLWKQCPVAVDVVRPSNAMPLVLPGSTNLKRYQVTPGLSCAATFS